MTVQRRTYVGQPGQGIERQARQVVIQDRAWQGRILPGQEDRTRRENRTGLEQNKSGQAGKDQRRNRTGQNRVRKEQARQDKTK